MSFQTYGLQFSASQVLRHLNPTTMLGSASSYGPIRLPAVPGYEGRINDIIYSPPQARSEEETAVIYFGGDVQVLYTYTPSNVLFFFLLF